MSLLNFLIRGTSSTGQDVLRLGTSAATEYVSAGGDRSLNDILTKTAKAEGLNREQINRVCEVANNATFGLLFKKEADKNITFPVAEPEKVAAAVTKVGPGVEKTATCGEVHGKKKKPKIKLQPRVKKAYIYGSRGKEIEEFLFGEALEKVASIKKPDLPYAEPLSPALRAMRKVAGIVEHTEALLEDTRMKLRGEAEQFVKSASSLLISGDASFPDLRYAIASSGVRDESFIKNAMSLVHSRIDEVWGLKDKTGLYKRGSGLVVNEHSPVIRAVKEMYKLACEYGRLKGKLEKGLGGKARAASYIKDKIREVS